MECQAGTKTNIYLRQNITRCKTVRWSFRIWSSNGFTCCIRFSQSPLAFTCFRIYTCILWQIQLIHRFTFPVDTTTIDQLSVQLWSQFQYFVLEVSQVEVDIPCEIFCIDDVWIQIQFNTTIHHRSYIFRETRVTHWRRYRLEVKHIGCLTREIFHCTTQLATPESEIETGIETVWSFPSNIRITFII